MSKADELLETVKPKVNRDDCTKCSYYTSYNGDEGPQTASCDLFQEFIGLNGKIARNKNCIKIFGEPIKRMTTEEYLAYKLKMLVNRDNCKNCMYHSDKPLFGISGPDSCRLFMEFLASYEDGKPIRCSDCVASFGETEDKVDLIIGGGE